MTIEDKTIEVQKLAVISHKGSMEDMEVLISQLFGWIEINEVEINGDLFAIYYTLPDKVPENEVVYDVGIPIKGEPTGNDLIKVVDMLEHNVLSTIHKGSYKDIRKSYDALVEYSLDNNYDIIGSPKEIYMNSPYDVSEEELLTEIQFPIIKM